MTQSHDLWCIHLFKAMTESDTNAKAEILATYTVNSRYLEVEGTLCNTSRYAYFDISDLQIEENTNRTTEFQT